MPVYPNYYYNNTTATTPIQMPVQTQTQAPHNNGFVWVQGIEAAKAYPVAAGNQILLMDSENPVLYMKSTDVSGRPLPMEVYDLVKREVPQENSSASDLSEYVRKDELKSLMSSMLSEMRPRKQNKPKKEEEGDV